MISENAASTRRLRRLYMHDTDHLTERDERLLHATDRESLDAPAEGALIGDGAARAKTLGFEETPARPEGPPGVIDQEAYTADAAVLMAMKSGREFHDKWAAEGIPVAEDQSERTARVAEDVKAWGQHKTLTMQLEQERSRTQVYATHLRNMITILGGDVPGPDDPAHDETLFGQAETALEALRVLKMNWDSIQPQLAAQAAAQSPVEVAVDGRSEPGTAE
jgi:hypothetical protein